MKKFYAEKGIIHRTSHVETSQQIGRMERQHRRVLNVARVLCFQANLPLHFCRECVLTSAHLINTKLLQGKTPYEVLFQQKPSYDRLRVFGSLYFTRNYLKGNDKLCLEAGDVSLWVTHMVRTGELVHLDHQ